MSACQACATACLQRGSLRTRVKEANAPANAQIYLSDALFLTHTRLRCLDIYLCSLAGGARSSSCDMRQRKQPRLHR